MVASIALDRKSAGGKYGPIIDVCERQKSENGSVVNALAEMVVESPTYQRVRALLDEEVKKKEQGNNSQEKSDLHGGGST